ncbi:MAG: PRC-barrel domain-containing protein [Solirubrobacteraceae bacterium]
MELGMPISYEVLKHGTPVLSSDGEQIGTVVHVLADEGEDVFDGIVIAEHLVSGHRFADADEIESIHERGVVLKLDRDECEQLPRPSANPAVMRDDPAETGRSTLEGKLKRAWDVLSGGY